MFSTLLSEISLTKLIGELPGKRMCMGEVVAKQTAFLFLTGLVHRFKFAQVKGQKPLAHNSLPAFTSRPHPFQVLVTPIPQTESSNDSGVI